MRALSYPAVGRSISQDDNPLAIVHPVETQSSTYPVQLHVIFLLTWAFRGLYPTKVIILIDKVPYEIADILREAIEGEHPPST